MAGPPRPEREPVAEVLPNLPLDDVRVETGRYHPVRVRAQLGYAILALLMLVIAFMALQTVRGYFETREFVEIVFPAVLASAGTAFGFYYSEQAERK